MLGGGRLSLRGRGGQGERRREGGGREGGGREEGKEVSETHTRMREGKKEMRKGRSK